MTKQEELNYPRAMMVSGDKKFWVQRVVFMEKASYYLAWSNAETIEEAKSEMTVIPWRYAKELKAQEKPANGEATKKELYSAWEAAREAREDAARVARDAWEAWEAARDNQLERFIENIKKL